MVATVQTQIFGSNACRALAVWLGLLVFILWAVPYEFEDPSLEHIRECVLWLWPLGFAATMYCTSQGRIRITANVFMVAIFIITPVMIMVTPMQVQKNTVNVGPHRVIVRTIDSQGALGDSDQEVRLEHRVAPGLLHVDATLGLVNEGTAELKVLNDHAFRCTFHSSRIPNQEGQSFLYDFSANP